jgi:hypothetical protein
LGTARALLYALPLFTIIVVSYALFVVGTPRPVTAARIWSGPTEGASRIAARVSVIERYRGIESPAAVDAISVEARASDGRSATWTGKLDDRGVANPVLEFGAALAGPVAVRVREGGKILADGSLHLSPDEWRKSQRDLGGFIAHGSRSGTLLVQVAPARGALAVPFEEALLVEVRNAQGPVRDVEVSFEPDGLAVAKQDERKVTDAFGRASVRITPREHVISLRVNAKRGDEKGSWFGRLPIVPGAFHVRLDERGLEIVSPIPRDVAYYAVITHARTLVRGSVALEPRPNGLAAAHVPLPERVDEQMWALASGEPELDSSSTVGWPLRPGAAGGEPLRSRVVLDPLLADGTLGAEAVDGQRRTRARWIAGGVTLIAVILASVLFGYEGRRSRLVLEAHLEESFLEDGASERISDRPGRMWGVAIAILCVALGFLVVALVALQRIE